MNIKEFFDLIGLFITTIVSLFIAILKAMFSISDSVDSIKETIIAVALGIPVAVVSAFFLIVGGIHILKKLFSNK